MSDVIIIGDGPAGLSGALFLAKNGQSVEVFAQDKTLMHLALLINYLSIPRMTGTEFQKIARKQVTDQGGTIIDAEVTGVARGGAGFIVTTADQKTHEANTWSWPSVPHPNWSGDSVCP